jgi:hypothetical protein
VAVGTQLGLLGHTSELRDGGQEVVRWRELDGVQYRPRHSKGKASEDADREPGAQELKVADSTVQGSHKGATHVAGPIRDLKLYGSEGILGVETAKEAYLKLRPVVFDIVGHYGRRCAGQLGPSGGSAEPKVLRVR